MIGLVLLKLTEAINYIEIHGEPGDVGYFYSEIKIGTPPVTLTGIIDTGSILTTFLCENYIDFDRSKLQTTSESSRFVTCKEGFSCSPCNQGNCWYKRKYAEGSSVKGLMIEDNIQFGDIHKRSVFGCNQEMTEYIQEQEAHGIIGFSPSSSNLPSLLDFPVFTVCLGMEGGYITMDGYSTKHHTSDIQWVPYSGKNYYVLNMHNIYYNSERVEYKKNLSNYAKIAIVDSGTTHVYFHKDLFLETYRVFYRYCLKDGNCGNQQVKVEGEAKSCYRYDDKEFESLEDFFRTFPLITIEFDGESIDWTPKQYLFTWFDAPSDYCVGFYNNFEDFNVLGSLFLRGRDVIFDKAKNRVGFASSDCEYSAVRKYSENEFECICKVEDLFKDNQCFQLDEFN